jgi:hypothetical protein
MCWRLQSASAQEDETRDGRNHSGDPAPISD